MNLTLRYKDYLAHLLVRASSRLVIQDEVPEINEEIQLQNQFDVVLNEMIHQKNH